MDLLINLNLNKNELQNAVLQLLATAPQNPVEGQMYYNSTDHQAYQYNGSAWTPMGGGGSGGGDVTSVNNKTGAVTLTQDDIGDGSTYKQTHNDLTDALVSAINASASKAYVDALLAASDAMIFKGTIGASGATVTALPATHDAGWTYKAITAGTYAGQTCEIGDLIICIKDGTTAADADWTVVQTNIDGAVTGPASSADGHIPTFSGTSGKVIQDGYSVASSITNDSTSVPTTAAVYALIKSATGTISTSATSAAVSYSGTLINAYAVMDGEMVSVDIAVTAGAVTFSTARTPSAAVTCTVVYI